MPATESKKERHLAAAARYREKNRDRLREEQQKRYAADPEKRRRQWREFYHRHKDRLKEYSREYRRRNPEVIRARLRRYGTGMTSEEYDRLIVDQEGKCACCGEPPKEGKVLNADHDHKTGDTRGLLCSRCNTAIGVLESGLFSTWLAYLERYRK